MIRLTEDISLKAIKPGDSDTVYAILEEIYTPAYKHFWTDGGKWYLKKQYNPEAVLKEVLASNSAYYFVLYRGKTVGVFRFILGVELSEFKEKKALKLHRVYLHPAVQGKGIGKILLNWLEKKAIKNGYELIWLDAMDQQDQAVQFYKKKGYQTCSYKLLDFELLKDEYRKMWQFYKQVNL